VNLKSGTHLGAYEIVAAIGKGGMGEVYRARDSKLKREVAIKILPEEFSRDQDRIGRFQREAEVLASLNHANIASIYDLQEDNGSRFLILELVEGDTLAERIARGPLPLDEALSFAKQVAEALEAAHEKGIIHRDLKPANVKITRDGKVKVLDFGLAKAFVTEAASAANGFSHSPTLSLAASNAGVIIGTAAYMSPEQATGKTVDARSDIWSFGVVLYEMLSGKAAFAGDTVVEILGGILKVDPDWRALPATTPEAIRGLLRRSLQRDPKRRMKDIAEAIVEIDNILNDQARPSSITAPPAAVATKSPARIWKAAAAAMLIVAAVTGPLAIVHLREPATDTRVLRFTMTTPGILYPSPPAISPDGRRIAFVASTPGGSSLALTSIWVRSLDDVSPKPLAGTDGADYLFWSPDSRFIGFTAGGKLKKVDASGGPPQTLCDAPAMRGGAWNAEGTILFSPATTVGLFRVSSAGGESVPVTKLDAAAGESSHRSPSFLPDGRHYVYFAQGGEKQGIYIGSLDGQERRLVMNSASAALYADPGYLLFLRDTTLMAQPFDPQKLQLSGEAFPLAESVGVYAISNIGQFSLSKSGVLVYSAGAGAGSRQLAWFDRAGKVTERIGPLTNMFDIALSPDQKRAALQLRNQVGVNDDIWMIDLMRGVLSRFTFDPAIEDFPVWSPDGTRVLFNSNREGAVTMYQKISTGAGAEELVVKSSTTNNPSDWSRDGRFILYENLDPKTMFDIWVLPLTGDRKAQVLLQTPFNEQQGRFSPDGKWIAYLSDESGRSEVYVQSFPLTGAKWQISTNGGFIPRWRRDGKELFYISADHKMMSVDVSAGSAGFEVKAAKALFDAPVDVANALTTNRYEVSADGQRFLINAPAENTTSGYLTVVVNWLADQKK
jgi:eukaryotic-like serine/threonine-protein kinase